jgi:hypothetical protein
MNSVAGTVAELKFLEQQRATNFLIDNTSFGRRPRQIGFREIGFGQSWPGHGKRIKRVPDSAHDARDGQNKI